MIDNFKTNTMNSFGHGLGLGTCGLIDIAGKPQPTLATGLSCYVRDSLSVLFESLDADFFPIYTSRLYMYLVSYHN